jgi:hypothetical protein
LAQAFAPRGLPACRGRVLQPYAWLHTYTCVEVASCVPPPCGTVCDAIRVCSRWAAQRMNSTLTDRHTAVVPAACARTLCTPMKQPCTQQAHPHLAMLSLRHEALACAALLTCCLLFISRQGHEAPGLRTAGTRHVLACLKLWALCRRPCFGSSDCCCCSLSARKCRLLAGLGYVSTADDYRMLICKKLCSFALAHRPGPNACRESIHSAFAILGLQGGLLVISQGLGLGWVVWQVSGWRGVQVLGCIRVLRHSAHTTRECNWQVRAQGVVRAGTAL